MASRPDRHQNLHFWMEPCYWNCSNNQRLWKSSFWVLGVILHCGLGYSGYHCSHHRVRPLTNIAVGNICFTHLTWNKLLKNHHQMASPPDRAPKLHFWMEPSHWNCSNSQGLWKSSFGVLGVILHCGLGYVSIALSSYSFWDSHPNMEGRPLT